LKLPKARYAGKRVNTCAELVDVLPTLLQTAGIAIPRNVQGRSLLPELDPRTSEVMETGLDAQSPCVAYSETDYPRRAFGWSSLKSLRKGKYLAIDAPQKELYDQSIDKEARHNIYLSAKGVRETLFGDIDAFRRKTVSLREMPNVPVDPDQMRKLTALGYIPSDTTSPTLPGVKDTGSDPKEKIEVVNLLHRAELLSEEMHYNEAGAILEQVIKQEPNLPIAYLQLGTAYTILKDYQRALPILRKAVELRPELGTPQFELGSALFETGDFSGAAEQFQAVTAQFPDWADAHFYLGTSYARLNQMHEAIEEYNIVTQLRPKHYAAHLLLGRALSLTGQFEPAITPLRRASELEPQSAEPHHFLYDVYTRLNRKSDAEKEKLEAERLSSR